MLRAAPELLSTMAMALALIGAIDFIFSPPVVDLNSALRVTLPIATGIVLALTAIACAITSRNSA